MGDDVEIFKMHVSKSEIKEEIMIIKIGTITLRSEIKLLFKDWYLDIIPQKILFRY